MVNAKPLFTLKVTVLHLSGKELNKEKKEKNRLKKEHEDYGKLKVRLQKLVFLVKASEETLQKQKDTSSRELEEKNRTISKMEDDHNAEIKALYKQIAYLHDQPVRKHPRLDSGSSMSYQT